MNNRDHKRLELIRSLPCCECGLPPRSEAAHSNFGEHGKGKGIKACDKYTIPLCRSCHARFDKFDMGMDHDESIEWFSRKLVFINKVLSEVESDDDFIF